MMTDLLVAQIEKEVAMVGSTLLSRCFTLLMLLATTVGYAHQPDEAVRLDASHQDADQVDFLSSFLKHYEFSLEGRYVHEYHPFVLKKTRESFLSLEDSLRKNDLSLDGRMIILGYEEQGVPSYYTDFMKPKINDEAMVKGKAGWSIKLHNCFGFMTGFLLKDVNRIAQLYKLGDNCVFEHINADEQLIFNDKATVFQEHAFGQARDLIVKNKSLMNKLISAGQSKKALEALVPFWSTLYSGSFKVGNGQIAGTQDILFSIEYGRYLLSSKTQVRKCFIGPDITYPIEVFAKQERAVTRNSQAFVKTFVPNLKPINDEATVYIFCSFVDGVGKSTMLGNIKNWMKHAGDVEKYDHVDNSSSQLAELFQFKNNVFIADLPAQLSHYTYKPDGLVYVDVRTELSTQDYNALDAYVLSNKKELIERYFNNLNEVRRMMRLDGPHAPTQQNNPVYHFLRNLILLKKTNDNTWIPCPFNGEQFLFNMAADGQYRTLLPLGKAKSEGLKNVEADQMLFVEGVRLPLPYDYFVHDLVTRLKEAAIKRVVFVDFLSMYPRSSRENIRVNYLLQQLALLDTAFDVQQSMYRTFTTGGELLYCLLDRTLNNRIVKSLELESFVRWKIFSMIKDRTQSDLVGYSEETLTKILAQSLVEVQRSSAYSLFKKDLKIKLDYEKRHLEEAYGKAKSFVNVQLFSMHDAYSYYQAIQFFMTTSIENSIVNRVWRDVGSIKNGVDLEHCEQGFLENVELETDTGKKVRMLYKIHETCRNELLLAPFLRMLRSSWLTAIGALFFGGLDEKQVFTLHHLPFPHLPAHLVPGQNGYWYIVQEIFEEAELEEQPYYVKILNKIYGISPHNKPVLSMVKNTPCIGSTPHVQTNLGIFDYDCSLSKKASYTESAMTKLVRKLQKDASVDVVTPLIDAFHGLSGFPAWSTERRSLSLKTKKGIKATPEMPCGLFAVVMPPEETTEGQKPQAMSMYAMSLPIHRNIKDIFTSAPWQDDIVRHAIRLWFTLDMVIKDPESELVVRLGNRLDTAAAATLLEAVMIPKYFGLQFENNLFEDYEKIELFPSDEYWADTLKSHVSPELDDEADSL